MPLILFLRICFSLEFLVVYNKSFVSTFANFTNFIKGCYFKSQFSTVNSNKLAFGCNFHIYWSSR